LEGLRRSRKRPGERGDEYFVISLLDYDATDVEMLGPDVTGTGYGLGFSGAGSWALPSSSTSRAPGVAIVM
jgi:hypothetical protein